MATRLKDYKGKVMGILRDVPDSRNNDGLLIAHFIHRFASQHLTKDANGEWAIPLKNLKHLPPFETIRRTRQIIQNDDHAYLPTILSVRKARSIKEENWRNWEVREAQSHQP